MSWIQFERRNEIQKVTVNMARSEHKVNDSNLRRVRAAGGVPRSCTSLILQQNSGSTESSLGAGSRRRAANAHFRNSKSLLALLVQPGSTQGLVAEQ